MTNSPKDRLAPFCFDGLEEDLAVTIVEIHDQVVSSRGFNPITTERQDDEILGRVISAVSSSFSSHFGITPAQRYEDLFVQLAEFASHLAKDHIFPDGNKRTTVIISFAILHSAGYTLNINDSADPEKNLLYQWIQDVVTNEKDISELAEFLRDHKIKIK
jgi:death-on-curing protein